MKNTSTSQRLLAFYFLALIVMLAMYYVLAYSAAVEQQKLRSQQVFSRLLHELKEHRASNQTDLKVLLKKPFIRRISYQLILMAPSGQTYIHDYYRSDDTNLETVTLPQLLPLHETNLYTIDNTKLSGWIDLDDGYQVYVNLYHKPVNIEWTAYRYWVPILVTIVLLLIGMSFVLKRRNEWEQLIGYTESLSLYAKESYASPPFTDQKVATEFLRMGHALSRINYQLHKNYRRSQLLNHRLNRLIDHAPLPMLTIKRYGKISFANQRFEQVFSTTFQDNVRYTLTDFFTGIDKATHQTLSKLATQRVTRTLLVDSLEDGQRYQLHIMPWFGEHGQIYGFTGVLNNIHALTQQLADSEQELQQQHSRLADFDKLWSIMGHELRTPLSGMIGMLDLLLMDGLNSSQTETVKTLKQASQSMLSMLNGMLDMAKIDAGKLKVASEPVDILALCKQICELMVGNARRQGVELHYFFDPQCPRYLTTDAGRLQQILMNLISNAIKFTQSGYVALIIEPMTTHDSRYLAPNQTHKPNRLLSTSRGHQQAHSLNINDVEHTINARATTLAEKYKATSLSMADESSAEPDINLADEHLWLCFSVKDTGIGIEQAEQSKLFSFFNQANDSISQQFGGTGLGLAISNSFAQLLGGFIHLESEPKVGSTFSICLPRHQPSFQPVYPFNSDFSDICLIAFVNDEISARYLRQLFNHLLLPAIVRTVIDTNSVASINKQWSRVAAAQLKPIVLMDYELHQHSDLSVLTAFNIYATSPKILLSMMPERGIASQIIAQFDGFLAKPLDIGYLISEISRLSQYAGKPSPYQNGAASNGLPFDSIAQAKYQLITYQEQANHNSSQATAAKLTSPPDSSSDESKVDESKAVTATNTITIAPASDQAAKPVSAITIGATTAADAIAEQASAVPSDTDPLTGHHLILVAEDQPMNQKVACKVLEKLGYRSLVAENGEEAISLLERHRAEIALILMDCRMPILDGISATKHIRSGQDAIPIIALTANDSEEDQLACMQAGMDGFLAKPLKKDKLAAMLAQFLPHY